MKDIVLASPVILPISSDKLINCAIAISKGKIVDIDQTKKIKSKFPNFEFISKRNSIILPGFINAHTHLELGWIKSKIKNFSSFIAWLEQIILVKSEKIPDSEIKNSVINGIKDLIYSGVTTVGEISSYDGLDIDILKNSGLRTVLFKEIVDSKIQSLNSMHFEKEDLYEERPFPHAPYSCSPKLLEDVFNISYKEDIPLAIHLAESGDEVNFLKNKKNGFEEIIFPLIEKENFKRETSASPAKYIASYLKDRKIKLSAVHMIQIDEEDIDLINNYDISIILCPRSNILLKVGKPKLELIKNLKRVGLGTDGLSSNHDLNFFEELREINKIFVEKKIRNNSFLSIYLATLG
ncbi:MAG: amidohydrolase family protein, partial [Thermodesulfobacteriota bacterium]